MPRPRYVDASPGHLARLATGLGALVVLAGLTAGLPLLLRYAATVMLPHGWTPLDELRDALTSPDDGTLFAQALIAAGWGVWATFSLLVLWEIMRRLLDRQPDTTARVHAPHGLAGLLVAAVAALTTSPVSSTQATTVAVVATDNPPPDNDRTPPEPASQPHYITHLVERGEGLLDVAEKYHLTWEQVAEANYSKPQPDGGTLEPGRTIIYPGWQLRIPVAPAPASGLVAVTEDESATVHAGMQKDAEQQLYEVAKGDWMWHIAGRYLGDEQRYTEIAALNPQYLQRYPDYPDHIQPGDRLVLPDDAYDHGERPHATGGLAAPADRDPRPEPAPPASPAPPAFPGPPTTPPSSSPEPSTPPSPSPTAAASPSPSSAASPAAPGNGPGEHPDAGPDEPAADDEPSDAGVVLPTGAWVSFGLAALITSAALLLRLQRRRRARLHTRPIPTSLEAG